MDDEYHTQTEGSDQAPALKPVRPRRTLLRRAQAVAEAAVVLPVIIILSLLLLDLGRAWYGFIGVSAAARAGALMAEISPTSFVAGQACDATTNKIMCRVLGEANGSLVTISPSDVSVSCAPAACSALSTWGELATVTVQGHFTISTPFLSLITGPTITFTSSATTQILVIPS